MDGKEDPLSLVYVPIIAGDTVLGVISLQSLQREHAFSEPDVRLLETLANALSVALQNAQSFKAEQERVAELQIINSIQQGLAAELDFQAIVDLVGDKLREVFSTPSLVIYWYDENANLLHPLYFYEQGKRLSIPPAPPRLGGTFETEKKTRKPVVFNSLADYEKYNAVLLEGTEQGKSYAAVPIISGDRVLGSIGLENFERENAYGESELRLLTTIAARSARRSRMPASSTRPSACSRSPKSATPSWPSSTAFRLPSPPSLTSRAFTTRSGTRSARSSTRPMSASGSTIPRRIWSTTLITLRGASG
jgi:GAF domain-containing protein